MDLKKIHSNIKLIAGNYAKVNALVQVTAVAIIEHAQAHGDCTPALKLVQAMPKSARRGLLINWFAKYSPIGMNLTSGKVAFHKEGTKLYNKFDVEAARANNWYEGAEADKEDLPVTLEEVNKMVFALATRLQKKLDAGEVPANDVEPVKAQIVALRAVGKAEYKRQQAAKAQGAKPAAKAA